MLTLALIIRKQGLIECSTCYASLYTRERQFCLLCFKIFVFVCVYSIAPQIDGSCEFVNATNQSLTFMWNLTKSATIYRIDGNGVSLRRAVPSVIVNDLTPGSHYTFTVQAVGAQSLVSNNITCINSTGRM